MPNAAHTEAPWYEQVPYQINGHTIWLTPGSPLHRKLTKPRRIYPHYGTNPPSIGVALHQEAAREGRPILYPPEAPPRMVEIMKTYRAEIAGIPKLAEKMKHAWDLDDKPIPADEEWTPEEAAIFDSAAEKAWHALTGERAAYLPSSIARPLNITASSLSDLSNVVSGFLLAGSAAGFAGKTLFGIGAGIKSAFAAGTVSGALKAMGRGFAPVGVGAAGEAAASTSFFARHPGTARLIKTAAWMGGLTVAQEAAGAIDSDVPQALLGMFDTYMSVKYPGFRPAYISLAQLLKGEITSIPHTYLKELVRPAAEHAAFLPEDTQRALHDWIGEHRQIAGDYVAGDVFGMEPGPWRSIVATGLNIAIQAAVSAGIGLTQKFALKGIENLERMRYLKQIAGNRWPQMSVELKRAKPALTWIDKTHDPIIETLQKVLLAERDDKQRQLVQKSLLDVLEQKALAVAELGGPADLLKTPLAALRKEAAFMNWLFEKKGIAGSRYDKLPAEQAQALLRDFGTWHEAGIIQAKLGHRLPEQYTARPERIRHDLHIRRVRERGSVYIGPAEPPRELAPVKIKIKDIDADDLTYQGRERVDMERVKMMVAGYDKRLDRPILLQRMPDGRLITIGGAHRIRMHKSLGSEEINAYVISVPDAEAKRLAILDNEVGKGHTPLECAKTVAFLRDYYTSETYADQRTGEIKKGMTPKEALSQIAKDMAVSPSTIASYYDLFFLPPGVKTAVSNKTLSTELAQVYGAQIRKGRLLPEQADALYVYLKQQQDKGFNIATTVKGLERITNLLPQPKDVPTELTLFGHLPAIEAAVSPFRKLVQEFEEATRRKKKIIAITRELEKDRATYAAEIAALQKPRNDVEALLSNINEKLSAEVRFTTAEAKAVALGKRPPEKILPGEPLPEPTPDLGVSSFTPPPLSTIGHKTPGTGEVVVRPEARVHTANPANIVRRSHVSTTPGFQHRLGGGVPTQDFRQLETEYFEPIFRAIGSDWAVLKGDEPGRGAQYVAKLRRAYERERTRAFGKTVFAGEQQRRVLASLESPDVAAVKALLSPEEFKIYQFWKRWDKMVWKIAYRIDPKIGYIENHLFHIAAPGARRVPAPVGVVDIPRMSIEEALSQVAAPQTEIVALKTQADTARVQGRHADADVADIVYQRLVFDNGALNKLREAYKGSDLRIVPKLAPEALKDVPKAPWLLWTTRLWGSPWHILRGLNPYNPVTKHVWETLNTCNANLHIEDARLKSALFEHRDRLGLTHKQVRRAVAMAVSPALYKAGTLPEQEMASLFSAAINYLQARGASSFNDFLKRWEAEKGRSMGNKAYQKFVAPLMGEGIDDAFQAWMGFGLRQIHIDPHIPGLKTLVAQLGKSYTSWFEKYYLPYITGTQTPSKWLAGTRAGKAYTTVFSPRLQYAAGLAFNPVVGVKNLTQRFMYGIPQALHEGGVDGLRHWGEAYRMFATRIIDNTEWNRIRELGGRAGIWADKEMLLFDKLKSFSKVRAFARRLERVANVPMRWSEAHNKMADTYTAEKIGLAKGLSGDALLNYIYDYVNRIHFVSSEMNLSWAQMNPMMRPLMVFMTYPLRSVELVSGLLHEASQGIRLGQTRRGVTAGLEAAGLMAMAVPVAYYGSRAIGLDPLTIVFPGVETVARRSERLTRLIDLAPSPIKAITALLRASLTPEGYYEAARQYTHTHFPAATQTRRVMRYIDELQTGEARTRKGQTIAALSPNESFLKMLGVPLEKVAQQYESAAQYEAAASEYFRDHRDLQEAYIEYGAGKRTRDSLANAIRNFEREYPAAFRTDGKKDRKKIKRFVQSVDKRKADRATPIAMSKFLSNRLATLPLNAPPEFYQDYERLRQVRKNFRQGRIDKTTMMRLWESFNMKWGALLEGE